MKTMKQFMTEKATKKIDIVPTPGQGEGQQDDYTNPAAPAEKAFKDKHVIQKTDYPVKQKDAKVKDMTKRIERINYDAESSTDDIFSGNLQKKKARLADQEHEQSVAAYEEIEHSFQLGDGTEIELSQEDVDKLSEFYEALTDENKQAFMSKFTENRLTNDHLMNWVRELN